mgnify:CR=1 FL=1
MQFIEDGVSNIIFESNGHSEKAYSPIDVTDEGIDTSLRKFHPEKNLLSIDVKNGGIDTSLFFL